MTPQMKRFVKTYRPIYDAVASLDLDQEVREEVATALRDSIVERGDPDFKADTFWLLAADPLVPCAGFTDLHGDDLPCPDERVIRIAMHLDAPGRSDAWRQRAPYGTIRCTTCGAKQFIPGYLEAQEAGKLVDEQEARA